MSEQSSTTSPADAGTTTGSPTTAASAQGPVRPGARPPERLGSTGSTAQDAVGPVDAVVLDYGNVLYTWDAVGAVAGRVLVADWDEFVSSGEFGRLNAMADRGTPFEEILDDLRSTHPDRPDWERLQRLYWEHFADTKTGPVPGTGAIVDELLDAGVPLYALTNFHDVLFERTRHMVPQLPRFTGIVVSGEEHLAKPEPEIYRVLLERYGLDASRTLFVDDSPANVKGARAVGMRAHLFVGAGRLRAELTERGLLPPRD